VDNLQAAPSWVLPMNSQVARTEPARQLIRQCGIARVVETGTYRGTTTEFFAQFGVPVTTIEKDPDYVLLARARLDKYKNVDLGEVDSVIALRALAQKLTDRAAPTLFYLDTHRQEQLPLREEAELALANFPKAVLMVDDFEVPDDPGYGFDDYGPGKRLCLGYLQQAKLPPVYIYFPATPSQRETGARRGCVVITADAGLAAILDANALLRRWET
jgi:hypothetical protein